jgi:hypothetical protein
MENTKIQHWKRNEFKWHEKEQVEENKTLKSRFKQAMTRLKESVLFDYEPEDLEDDEMEEVD